MSMDLFRKIIDEAADIPVIDLIRLNGLNEPLLDRFIVSRYQYIKSKGLKSALYTNGVYLTPTMYTMLKDAGLDFLTVSLNATSEPQHRLIMGLRDKFDTVCANIDNAIAVGGIDLEVHAVMNRDTFTKAHAGEFIKRWGHKRYGGYGKVIIELNWAGENRTVRAFDPAEWCVRATNQINILCDGRVSTCCVDMLGKQIFGDTKTQTLREIYNSEAYTTFREDHSQNRADRYEICAKCTRG